MRVLIIGGTSGIGLALAVHYLQQGDTVAVCGRNPQRLDPALIHQYPMLQIYALDITDKPRLAEFINAFAQDSLDLVIVCAGVYYSNRHHDLSVEETLQILQTNVSGLNHAFELAATLMLQQQSGHLVAIASVAGLLKHYPGASAYAASKRHVLNLCDTYRQILKPFSISVTAIAPGYINTARLRALNEGDVSRKPFLVSEDAAVKIITSAIHQRKTRCIFPWPMRAIVWLFNCVPDWLARTFKKPPQPSKNSHQQTR